MVTGANGGDNLPARVLSLEEMAQNHDVQVRLLINIAERQQDLLGEVRRDAANNQRLWTRVARRYGWLEDDDLLSP